MAASFFDTNVLLYIASQNTEKANRAEQLIAEGGHISVQVLNELTNVTRRKFKLSWPETRAMLAGLRGLLTVHPVTLDVHQAGIALAERYNLSIYDAMIAAAALECDCATLWSEDMQHGMQIAAKLRIANPFVASRQL
jgi:predicted nucleic acid-binding protein